jgi:hypothetical protein
VRTTLIAEITRRSRELQGLPARVEDRAALARVADLLDEAT